MNNHQCEADPFRSHLRNLITDTAQHWRLLSAHANVRPSALKKILTTPKPHIHKTLARAIANLNAEDLARADHTTVPAKPSRELLTALENLGCNLHTLPFVNQADIHIKNHQHQACSKAAAARIQAAHDWYLETHHEFRP